MQVKFVYLIKLESCGEGLGAFAGVSTPSKNVKQVSGEATRHDGIAKMPANFGTMLKTSNMRCQISDN